MKKGLVTIIIPTKNSSHLLSICLQRIAQQHYKNIEVLVIDSKSNDQKKTEKLTKKHHFTFISYDPKVKKGLFDATKKRNYAVKKSHGEFIYHFDADMEITKNILSECVKLCNTGSDAVIVTEDSFGHGIWAQAKNLERRFFWGDDSVESPRFFKRTIWDALNGYDENIAGGGDDRDIYQRMLKNNYKVARTKNLLLHNEGNLTLKHLFKKQFMYKREVLKYIKKHPSKTFASFSPIRASYFKHPEIFLKRPIDSFFLVIMKSAEIIAGISGVLYSILEMRNRR